MPPPPPPKDTVDIIVERLKQSKGITMGNTRGNKNKNKIMKNSDDAIMIVQQISVKTVQETKSALRVFNIQHPHKLLGKADNQWKRACALLEFTTRRIQGIKIPLFLLAKIAKSSSTKEFEKFHDMVGNLRRSTQTKASSIPLQQSYRPRTVNNAGTTDRRTSTATATTKKNDTNSGAMISRKQQHYSSKPTNHHDVVQKQQQRQRINLKKSSLPFLAIKLFAYVEDSHGVSKRAQQLLNQLMEPPSRQRQQQQQQQQQQQGGGRSSAIVAAREHQQLLLDIQTHQSTYEAVCYYIVAKTHDDDNETNLTVEIMLQFTTDFTAKEFRTIHEFVSSTDAAKIVLEDPPTTRKMPPTESSSSPQKNIAGMKRPRRSSLRGDGKQKRAKNPSTITAVDNDAMTNNIMNYDDNNSHDIDDTPQFSLEFLNWKEKVLKEAIQEQFQKQQQQQHHQKVVSTAGSGGGGQEHKEKGKDTGDDDSSPLMLPWDKEMEALHQAASQILNKHGLLQL